MAAVVPKKATTVILLREAGGKGFEVFLLKRHEKARFMGGNYVYPGGRVDGSDADPEIIRGTAYPLPLGPGV
jgi:8-oxo-dGTP pyrophosphatase MutT (NUDIX family)